MCTVFIPYVLDFLSLSYFVLIIKKVWTGGSYQQVGYLMGC